MQRRKGLKSRKRSCPPPTVEQTERRRLMVDAGCVIGWLKLGKKIPGQIHHINTGGKHGQKVLGEDFTICLNQWSHQGYALTEYGWDAARCRAELGPSFEKEPAAFRDEFDFAELLVLQNRLIERAPGVPSWMR